MRDVPFITRSVRVKHSWIHLVIKRGQSIALNVFIVLLTDVVFLTCASIHASNHNFTIAAVNLVVLGRTVNVGDVLFVGFGDSALLVGSALFTTVELVVGK